MSFTSSGGSLLDLGSLLNSLLLSLLGLFLLLLHGKVEHELDEIIVTAGDLK